MAIRYNVCTMSEDEFTRLFKYLQEEFKSVREEIAEAKESVNTYANAVDAYAKQTETYMHEMLALGHQVDRHERWILKTATTTGVKLSA